MSWLRCFFALGLLGSIGATLLSDTPLDSVSNVNEPQSSLKMRDHITRALKQSDSSTNTSYSYAIPQETSTHRHHHHHHKKLKEQQQLTPQQDEQASPTLLQNNIPRMLEQSAAQKKAREQNQVVRHQVTLSTSDLNGDNNKHDIQDHASIASENTVAEMLCLQRMSRDIGSKAFIGVQSKMRTTFIGALAKPVVGTVLEPVMYVISYILVVILLLTVGRNFMIGMIRAQYYILPPCLDMLMGPMVADGLTQRLARTMTYTLGDALAELLLVNMIGQIMAAVAAFMGLVSAPSLGHRVVKQVSNHIAKDTLKYLKVGVVQGITHSVIHDVTHKIIHTYYCDYCHWYNEYCEYCFYYGDFTWMHALWSLGGEGDGNPFGGVMSTA